MKLYTVLFVIPQGSLDCSLGKTDTDKYLDFMVSRCYYVYILTNALKTVLYTGVTNDLEQRIFEHYKYRGQGTSFTSKYNVYFLLYYEQHPYINNAIAREKEIKSLSRKGKMELISTMNPQLDFLNKALFGEWPPKELTERW